MLTSSQLGVLASSSLPSHSQSDEVWRWSITALMGNVITTETRKIGYTLSRWMRLHTDKLLCSHTGWTDLKSTELGYNTTLFVSTIVHGILFAGCVPGRWQLKKPVKQKLFLILFTHWMLLYFLWNTNVVHLKP